VTRRAPETLAEFMERHRRMWAAQGLPPKVTDSPTLDAIAVIVKAARRTRAVEEARAMRQRTCRPLTRSRARSKRKLS
jgi:hypothetical protein